MFLIDTNVFIELLLGQERAEEAYDTILQLLLSNKPIYISSFSFHSILVILERTRKEKEIKVFCELTRSTNNLKVVYLDFDEEMVVLNSRKILKMDFDDAYQYFVAKKLSIAIITFDKHFDKTKDVVVINPLTKRG